MNQAQPLETYHCKQCGRESTVKEAFLFSKGSTRQSQDATCFECHNKKQAASLGFTFIVVLLFGLFLYVMIPDGWLGKFYLEISAGILLCVPLIVLHELSHTLVSRALRFHVFAIHIGVGKVFFATRFLRIQLVLHSLPIGGVTMISGPKSPDFRRRLFLIHLAGPALHALLIILTFWLLPVFQENGLARDLIMINLWTNIFLLLSNIYPRKAATTVGVAGTDGWALLNIFRLPDEKLEKYYASYYALQAVTEMEMNHKPAAKHWVEEGLALYPDNPFTVNAAGYVYSHLGENQKARQAFVKALELGDEFVPGLRYVILNNIAYSDILLDDPALLDEADAYSAEAYKNFPWESVIGGTRGAVLIFLGQENEGIDLLKTAMSSALNPDGKASNACLIAIGEHKCGHHSEAQKYFSAARQLDPECPLLERASYVLEKEINPAECSSSL